MSVPAADMCERLLVNIRRQFYPDQDKPYFQQRRELLRAITYPAAWLKGKGVFLPLDRYERVIMEQLQEIKRHGATDQIRHFPGYLGRCLKLHFQHQAETYYNEGKDLRNLIDLTLTRALAQTKAMPARDAETQTNALASAHHDILAAGRPRRKKIEKKLPPPNQIELF